MDNVKKYLQENQHIVYETLKNSYKSSKTTHAYIINGTKGSPVLEIAKFMAKSFICLDKDENNLACEHCINCEKIEKNGYADFKIINGVDLKTDAVLNLQDEYSKSAIEQEQIKIYIIHLIENAPISSLNKLLKFIEEPTSNIVALFTSNSISSILPTIVSRCQTISLKEFTINELVNYLIQNNVNEEDAYLLARISNDVDVNLKLANDENYKVLKEVVNKSLDFIKDGDDMFIVYMETEGFKKLDIKSEDEKINFLDIYLDILEACFLQAAIKKEDKEYTSKFYDSQISVIAKKYGAIDKMIEEVTKAKLALISLANKQLALDKLLIHLLRK